MRESEREREKDGGREGGREGGRVCVKRERERERERETGQCESSPQVWHRGRLPYMKGARMGLDRSGKKKMEKKGRMAGAEGGSRGG